MAGELILNEVASPSTPASGKQAVSATNDSPSRLSRIGSDGYKYYEQEFAFIGLTADRTLTNTGALAEALFNNPANGAITLPAGTSWEFEAMIYLSNTGITSHTWSTLFGGTATFTSLAYFAEAYTGASNALTAVSGIWANVATALTVTPASTSSSENVVIKLRGLLRVNAGGTVIPQIKPSAATGGTAKVLANSFFRLSPVGSNTAASIGNWS